MAADPDPELSETVDSLLSEHGYAEIPEDEAYGPGDAEAEALSDFADELAGGRDNVTGSSVFEDAGLTGEDPVDSPENEGREL